MKTVTQFGRTLAHHLSYAAVGVPLIDYEGYKSLWERFVDWDWNVIDLWHYFTKLLMYWIHELGWVGWIIVPLAAYAFFVVFKPTRYIASLIGVDVWRHTASNLIGGAFRGGWSLLAHLVGLGFARFRVGIRFLIDMLR